MLSLQDRIKELNKELESLSGGKYVKNKHKRTEQILLELKQIQRLIKHGEGTTVL